MARFRPAEVEPGAVAGALGPHDWSELDFPALGGPCRLAVKGGGPLQLIEAQHRVVGLDQRWDVERPDSLLAQVAHAGGKLVPVDEETYALLERTGVGVDLDPVLTRVAIAEPAAFPFDAVAQAGIADLVAAELVAEGAGAAMVDLSGTLRLAGDGDWAVDIDGPGVRIGLGEGAVATAYADEGGASATVIAEDALVAALRAEAALAGGFDEDPRPTLLVDDDGSATRHGGFEAYERPG